MAGAKTNDDDVHDVFSWIACWQTGVRGKVAN